MFTWYCTGFDSNVDDEGCTAGHCQSRAVHASNGVLLLMRQKCKAECRLIAAIFEARVSLEKAPAEGSCSQRGR